MDNELEMERNYDTFRGLYTFKSEYMHEIQALKRITMEDLQEMFIDYTPDIYEHMSDKLAKTIDSNAYDVTSLLNLGLDAMTRINVQTGIVEVARGKLPTVQAHKLYFVLDFIVFCTQSVSHSDFEDIGRGDLWEIFYNHDYDILAVFSFI